MVSEVLSVLTLGLIQKEGLDPEKAREKAMRLWDEATRLPSGKLHAPSNICRCCGKGKDEK